MWKIPSILSGYQKMKIITGLKKTTKKNIIHGYLCFSFLHDINLNPVTLTFEKITLY